MCIVIVSKLIKTVVLQAMISDWVENYTSEIHDNMTRC